MVSARAARPAGRASSRRPSAITPSRLSEQVLADRRDERVEVARIVMAPRMVRASATE